jgi:hypothetical protein
MGTMSFPLDGKGRVVLLVEGALSWYCLYPHVVATPIRASEATVTMIPAALFVQRLLFGEFSSPDMMGSEDIWIGWRRGLSGRNS